MRNRWEFAVAMWVLTCLMGCEREPVPASDSAATLEETHPSAEKQITTSTNSLGMELVLVPAGDFQMGFAGYTTLLSHVAGERPAHHVVISQPFWMGSHEVTVGQFRQFVKETGYQTAGERTGRGSNTLNLSTGAIEQRSSIVWSNPGVPQTDDHPVTCVTWEDAQKFCEWLIRKEGKPYRLPTEAEWEYACRAGTETLWYSGREEASLRDYANLGDASLKQKFPLAQVTVSWNDQHAFTAPVGSFHPNAFGLHDMHGNVGEWCADWYDPTYYDYESSPTRDPKGPSEPQRWRVVRGGSWYNAPFSVRSSGRHDGIETAASITNGFRIVREVSATE